MTILSICHVRPAKTVQPVHPLSLIRVFAVRMSAQRRLLNDWADGQSDLSLRMAHSHFFGFVMIFVSITVTLGYHSCYTHIAKLYRKTPLVFNYYCRQKTIFYNSSTLIQMEVQIDFRVTKPIALIKERPSYKLVTCE